MHVDLHWLDVPERVKYKLVSMVHNCLHQKAPQYLTDCCIPISDVASRRHLRSASRHHLVVPRHNLSTYGRRAFAVAGPAAWNSRGDLFVPRTRTKMGTGSFRVAAPTVWNSLPTALRSTSVSRDTFKSRLKSHFYAEAYLHQV